MAMELSKASISWFEANISLSDGANNGYRDTRIPHDSSWDELSAQYDELFPHESKIPITHIVRYGKGWTVSVTEFQKPSPGESDVRVSIIIDDDVQAVLFKLIEL
jgi:hypothetical protein